MDKALLDRAGWLKEQLVEFASSARFKDERSAYVDEQLGRGRRDNDSVITAIDRFVLEWRDDEGCTIVDRFIESRSDLSDSDRAIVKRWEEVVESLFEAERHEDGAVVAVNLVNDLEHHVYSNRGERFTSRIPDGGFFHGRIVPLGDAWMLSGSTAVYQRSERDKIYRLALQVAAASPSMVFRNPEKLKRAWELQEQDRREFIQFFGSDLVILQRDEVPKRMREYMRFKTYEASDSEGLTRAEIAAREGRPIPPLPETDPADYPADAETVGFFYDSSEGQLVFYDLGDVKAAFEDPTLAEDESMALLLEEYFTEPDLSPLPLLRFGNANSGNATRLVRHVMQESDFEWNRDAEKLLREYKADYMDQVHLPSVIPVSERLTNPKVHPGPATSAAPQLGRHRIGRNDPCPCGSGRKYKLCCGR